MQINEIQIFKWYLINANFQIFFTETYSNSVYEKQTNKCQVNLRKLFDDNM